MSSTENNSVGCEACCPSFGMAEDADSCGGKAGIDLAWSALEGSLALRDFACFLKWSDDKELLLVGSEGCLDVGLEGC